MYYVDFSMAETWVGRCLLVTKWQSIKANLRIGNNFVRAQ